MSGAVASSSRGVMTRMASGIATDVRAAVTTICSRMSPRAPDVGRESPQGDDASGAHRFQQDSAQQRVGRDEERVKAAAVSAEKGVGLKDRCGTGAC